MWNRNTAAVRKFKAEFPHLNESTVREFKEKYNIEIPNTAKENKEVSKLIPKYSFQTCRPLLLGDLHSMVQTYIKQLSNRGGVVNRAIANATAQDLLIHYPNLALLVKSMCALLSGLRTLFQRMGFKKHRKTSSVDSARKEIKYLFTHDIVDTVERYKIMLLFILNLDQTPLKYVPVGNETMALSGANGATIEGSSDKCCITGTFAITMHGKFLPMHPILKGKIAQSLPRFKFSKGFCLTANEKHFSSRYE